MQRVPHPWHRLFGGDGITVDVDVDGVGVAGATNNVFMVLLLVVLLPATVPNDEVVLLASSSEHRHRRLTTATPSLGRSMFLSCTTRGQGLEPSYGGTRRAAPVVVSLLVVPRRSWPPRPHRLALVLVLLVLLLLQSGGSGSSAAADSSSPVLQDPIVLVVAMLIVLLVIMVDSCCPFSFCGFLLVFVFEVPMYVLYLFDMDVNFDPTFKLARYVLNHFHTYDATDAGPAPMESKRIATSALKHKLGNRSTRLSAMELIGFGTGKVCLRICVAAVAAAQRVNGNDTT